MIEVGVELRDGEDFKSAVASLESLLTLKSGESFASVSDVALAIESAIRHEYPDDRAYFIEAWTEGRSGWIQIFVPFGLPRSR